MLCSDKKIKAIRSIIEANKNFRYCKVLKYFLVFRAREALRQCLPDQLKDQTFANCLKDDKSTKNWLQQLLTNLESTNIPPNSDPRILHPMPGQ